MFCSRRIKPKEIRSILVSRRDAIGDVVLTLPLVGLLRRFYPSARLYFLGKTYTEGLISSCSSVDVFLNVSDWDELSSEQLAEKIK
ncbi:MAG: hypothetical protein KDD35_08100, partial [Bdellovibrionales bacterium]|nr:hypothetical protein [Bdellovibrionales bacterium]